MKKNLMLIFILFGLLRGSYGQQDSTWNQWSWLIGEWVGEGSGEPGSGKGTFSFKPGLDNKILIRKSHSEYPTNKNNSTIIHDDLMIVHLNNTGSPHKAIYFDNEGHTINYSIIYSAKSIELISDKTSSAPVFRLTYTLLDKKTINTKFEISHDGKNFTTYIEGKSKKIR